MDWREAIKDMRQAQENNRLVLFVGAGVSANSNLPTWYDLIKNIAQKVGYVKCSNSCDDCDKNVCNFKSSEYTQDEFLRIPKYLYAEGEEEYFKFITKHFVNDHEPNDIGEQMFRFINTLFPCAKKCLLFLSTLQNILIMSCHFKSYKTVTSLIV